MRKALVIVSFLLILLIITPEPAQAYLDPGSGSFIIQILIAGIVSMAFFIRNFWSQITGFITNLFKRPPSDEEQKN